MKRLKYHRAYLIGPMEHAADNGEDWRIRIQKELKDLDIVWLDPTKKPTAVALENEDTKHILQDLREKGDYNLLTEMMKPVRSYDLNMVDKCDFIVCYLSNNMLTTGTWEELFWANRLKRPIVIYFEEGKSQAPFWLFATIPHELIFEDWEEIYKYIRHIDGDSNINDLNRWKFFDFSLGRHFD